jgi:hypothetical protein
MTCLRRWDLDIGTKLDFTTNAFHSERRIPLFLKSGISSRGDDWQWHWNDVTQHNYLRVVTSWHEFESHVFQFSFCLVCVLVRHQRYTCRPSSLHPGLAWGIVSLRQSTGLRYALLPVKLEIRCPSYVVCLSEFPVTTCHSQSTPFRG